MAKGPFLLKKFPVPKTSIVIGSFVYNQAEPRQGFFDPSSKLQAEQMPKIDDSEIINPFRNRASSKSLWLKAMVSKILTGSFEASWGNTDELSAKKAIEYTLLDSDDWFDLVCANDDIKSWMEKAFMSGRKTLYLVTGYRTLSDAILRNKHNTSAKAAFKAEAPVSDAAGDASGSLNAGGSGGAKTDDTVDVGMVAQDEKIYEVQYRKVELRGFSSHSVDDAYLETGNRWIKVFTFRDGSGSAEEDAIEAIFNDEGDAPPGYQLVMEDGEAALIPEIES